MLCRGIWTLSCLEFSKVCPFHSTACMAYLSKICPVSTCWHYFEFYLGRDLLRKNCYSRFLKISKYFEENWRKELRFYDRYWKVTRLGKLEKERLWKVFQWCILFQNQNVINILLMFQSSENYKDLINYQLVWGHWYK